MEGCFVGNNWLGNAFVGLFPKLLFALQKMVHVVAGFGVTLLLPIRFQLTLLFFSPLQQRVQIRRDGAFIKDED